MNTLFNRAVRAIADEKWGTMVALQGNHIRAVPLGDAVHAIKRVPVDSELVMTARQLGVSFGD